MIDFGTTLKYLEDGFGEYEVYTLYVIDPGLPFEKSLRVKDRLFLNLTLLL